MSIATKKATIIKEDNKPYSSFNAYQRPKRKHTSYHKPKNVRVINLDPTDDPDQVCEAYRQIRIKEQYKRIAKNEARFAEKRRLAEIAAEKAAAKEAKREEKRRMGAAMAVKKRRESSKSVAARQRQALISKILKAGKPISLKASEIISGDQKSTVKDFNIKKEVEKLRVRGHDIVSIVSAGRQCNRALSISLFVIDDFERPAERINKIYAASQADANKVIIEALQKGFVLTADDVRASASAVRNAVYQLRLEGWPICIIKNRATDGQARGWILPCEANGLQAFIVE